MRSRLFCNVFLLTTLSSFMLQTTACNDDIEPLNIIYREVIENGFTPNGFTPNGFTPNGFTPNGFKLNSQTMTGVSLSSVRLDGREVSGLHLHGSSFNAASATGRTVSGLDFSGALATVNMLPPGAQQAVEYTLRFDRVYVDPQTPGGDIFLYDVSFARSGDATFSSLCADSKGNPVSAVPILNSWNIQTGERIEDTNLITFACISGAIGKCVRLGYRPWAQANSCTNSSCSPVSLANHHQACTRLIRADYCGNGKSYTLEGTPIEVYDGLSPQIQRQTMGWDIEAKWTPKGAQCLSDMRHAELISKGHAPDCDGDGKPDHFPRCGERDGLRSALLVSSFDQDAVKK